VRHNHWRVFSFTIAPLLFTLVTFLTYFSLLRIHPQLCDLLKTEVHIKHLESHGASFTRILTEQETKMEQREQELASVGRFETICIRLQICDFTELALKLWGFPEFFFVIPISSLNLNTLTVT
jgi:hypothetical protein